MFKHTVILANVDNLIMLEEPLFDAMEEYFGESLESVEVKSNNSFYYKLKRENTQQDLKFVEMLLTGDYNNPDYKVTNRVI